MKSHLAKLVLTGCVLVGGAATLLVPSGAQAGSLNGVGGTFPAYYDHGLLTINFMKLTTAQATLLLRNTQTNNIYQSDPGLPGGAPFVSVIDAIPADGMNPLWAESQITFTAGHTPRQLFSDTEVLAAQASGEITLTPTGELYRCSVIGATPRLTMPLTSLGRAGGTTANSTWGAVKAMYH